MSALNTGTENWCVLPRRWATFACTTRATITSASSAWVRSKTRARSHFSGSILHAWRPRCSARSTATAPISCARR